MKSITQKHYDNSLRLYKQFLDPAYMKYTSGLYHSGEETLEQAASQMLAKHVEYARRYSRPRILEIGLGWGSLLKKLHEELGADMRYQAVNPSPVQNDYIHTEIDPDVVIHETTFEEFDAGEDLFDVIYLVGAFCHFRDKPNQIAKLAKLLAPNGCVVFEDTYFINDALYDAHHARDETKFVQNDVFGFAHIMSLPSFLNLVSSERLVVQEILEHSDSYKRTINEWIQRLGEVDSREFPEAASYIQYMQFAQRGWNYTISNYLVTLKLGSKRLSKRADDGN